MIPKELKAALRRANKYSLHYQHGAEFAFVWTVRYLSRMSYRDCCKQLSEWLIEVNEEIKEGGNNEQ